MKLKATCLTWLAVYVVLAAAIGTIVYRRYPESGAAGAAAVFGGLAACMGVAYLVSIPKKIGEAMMIRRARSGEPPRDGERVAVIGRIVANAATLTSPFTGTPSVAYKYQIRSGDQAIYDGFAFTPSTIQTAQTAVRLLDAYPDLKVPPRQIPSAEAQPKAEEYIRSTSFRDPTIGNIRDSIAEMMEAFNDDEGSIRFDKRGGPTPDLSRAIYVEWIVRPGDQVCAIGHYSAAKHGLVPDPDAPLLRQVTIEQGQPDVFVGRSVRIAIGYLVGGFIFVGLAAAGLLALYTFVPLSASEDIERAMNASWPEIRLEHLLHKGVRAPLHEAGMLNAGVVGLTGLGFDTARGRLMAGGRDVPLSRASAVRRNDQTTITIDADTIVLTIDRRNRPTRLRIMREEISPHEIADALDLEITENSTARVAGRLTFVPKGAGRPACRVSFRALTRP